MIPFIMANIPAPAPGSTEQWLWAFAALLAIASLMKNLFVRVPPAHKEFASRDDLSAVRTEMDERLSRINGKIDALRAEMRDDRRTDRVAAESRVAELRFDIQALRDSQSADTKVILQQLGKLSGEIER